MTLYCPPQPPLYRRSPFPSPVPTPMSSAPHSPGQMTNQACANCARLRGCDACFEELVRRFQIPLLHFLIRRVGSRHDAEDLLQDVFVLAHRKLGNYRSSWRFSTWIFTIANNLATSAWRRRPPSQAAAAHPIQPLSEVDPLAQAEAKEFISKLWDTIAAILEPDAFAATWLSYVESMPADQIGQILGRSPNATRILLHRARARLSEQLAAHDDFVESHHGKK